MSNLSRIDSILREQAFSEQDSAYESVYNYAKGISEIERCVVVVSDLKSGTSRIFNGKFSTVLGLNGYNNEDSIWEKEILQKMTADELEEKYLTELRFYNFLRHIPRQNRSDYYLATNLRFYNEHGCSVDVLHRMYYYYENESEIIRFGVCVYGPLAYGLPAKSIAVNTITGKWTELSATADCKILSSREKQVLALIDRGLTSKEIADNLCISKNTVSRHRQEILTKLQAKNSTEACRRAKLMGII